MKKIIIFSLFILSNCKSIEEKNNYNHLAEEKIDLTQNLITCMSANRKHCSLNEIYVDNNTSYSFEMEFAISYYWNCGGFQFPHQLDIGLISESDQQVSKFEWKPKFDGDWIREARIVGNGPFKIKDFNPKFTNAANLGKDCKINFVEVKNKNLSSTSIQLLQNKIKNLLNLYELYAVSLSQGELISSMSLLITHSNFEGMKTVGNVLTNLMESNAKKDVILNAGKKVLFEKTNKDMQELLKKTLLNLPLMERMKDVDGKEYSKARKEFDELTNTIYALNGELNIMVGVQSATEMMEVMELLSFASSATKNEMMGKMNDTMNGYFNKLETQLNNKDNAEKYRNKDFLNRLQALKVFLEDSKLALKDGPSIREKISNIQKKVQ